MANVDSDHVTRTYKGGVNWPRLTLHRDLHIDRAMSTRQPLESFNGVVKLLKRKEVFGKLVSELTNFVKIMLALLHLHVPLKGHVPDEDVKKLTCDRK